MLADGAALVHCGKQDEDFSAISGIDDACVGEDTRGGHGGSIFDDEAESAAIDGDAGSHLMYGSRSERMIREGVEVVGQIFSGMGDGWGLCILCQQLNFQHGAPARTLIIFSDFSGERFFRGCTS